MPGEPKMPETDSWIGRATCACERLHEQHADLHESGPVMRCISRSGLRAEFAHQLSLVPVPKKKKPVKRAKPTVEPDSDVEMQSAQPAGRATGKGKGRAVAQVHMVTPPAPSYPEPGAETQAGALKDEWSPSQCPGNRSVALRGL